MTSSHRTDTDQPAAAAARTPSVADLGYEQARDELVEVVRRLEAGPTSLEESLRLWERGEALAGRCEQWLDGARRRVGELIAARDSGDTSGEPDEPEAG